MLQTINGPLAEVTQTFHQTYARIICNALFSELRYSAWGETRYSYGATPMNKQYTGQEFAEGGLYFYQARWYDLLFRTIG